MNLSNLFDMTRNGGSPMKHLGNHLRPPEGDWIRKWKTDRSFVTSLARGMEILRCFSSSYPELSVKDIAAKTGLPQQTAWRLCHTLKVMGYLTSAADSDRLTTTSSVLALGLSALPSAAADNVVSQELQKLADRFQVSAGLADRDRFSMIFLLRGRARPYLAVTDMRPGTRFNIYRSAAGWAYIAGMEPSERNDLFRQLKNLLGTQWPETEEILKKAIKEYSAKGFVTNCSVIAPGLNAVSAQVRLPRRARLAIACSAPEDLLPLEKMNREIGPELLRVAKRLETMLPSHA